VQKSAVEAEVTLKSLGANVAILGEKNLASLQSGALAGAAAIDELKASLDGSLAAVQAFADAANEGVGIRILNREDNARQFEELKRLTDAFSDLQKQMAIDILPPDQQAAARANQEFEARIKVIHAWRDAAIRDGQDVTKVNEQAAQATVDAWVTGYGQIKDMSEETSEFIRTAFERGFGAVSDALEGFLNDGFTSFEDFGKKILRTINSLLADQITLQLKDLMLGKDFGKQGAGVGGLLGDLFPGLFGQQKRQLPGTTAADRLDAERGQEMRDAAAAAIQGQTSTAEVTIQALSTQAQTALTTTGAATQTAITSLATTAQTSIESMTSVAITSIQEAAAAAGVANDGGGAPTGMPFASMFNFFGKFNTGGTPTDAGSMAEGGGLTGMEGMNYHSGGLVTADGAHATFRRRLARYHMGGEVNAVLKSGEYVVNDRAAGRIGAPRLDYMNATGRLPDGVGATARGSGAVVNNFHINATDAGSFHRSKRQMANQILSSLRRVKD